MTATVERDGEERIIAYVLLKLGVLPSDARRYAERADLSKVPCVSHWNRERADAGGGVAPLDPEPSDQPLRRAAG